MHRAEARGAVCRRMQRMLVGVTLAGTQDRGGRARMLGWRPLVVDTGDMAAIAVLILAMVYAAARDGPL